MKQILVVDDERRIRRFYGAFLSQRGYQTYEAGNADDANEILKREKIDVILLDIQMPAANGDTLYDVMKLFHRRVKVIVSSVLPVCEQQQLIQGAAAYYDKSESVEELFSKIAEVCGEDQTR